jgi:hypothetical protein
MAPANSRGDQGEGADRRAHRFSLSRMTKWSAQHEVAGKDMEEFGHD